MRTVRKILSVLLLALCIFSTGMVVKQQFDRQARASAQSSAQQLAVTPPAEVKPVEEAPKPRRNLKNITLPKKVWAPAPVADDPHMEALANINLNALREVNPEVVGWILIPDTGIDFPLTQAADNSFYLKHTWDLIPSGHGNIFLECMNTPEMTDFNTIIYGHHMRDGSMFAPLRHYGYQFWFDAHPYVYIVTDTGVYRYEIFSSYYAPLESKTYGLSFNQEKTRVEFLDNALTQSQISTGITPAITDRIITLSTCTGWGYDSRRVVHARLEMIQVYEYQQKSPQNVSAVVSDT